MPSLPTKKSPTLGGAPSPAPRPPAPTECRASLHGGLDQIALSTILTILDLERRSGLLVVRRQGEIGRLWLSGGRVVRARVDGPLRRGGKPAVFEVLSWQQGRFELVPGEPEVSDEIRTPTSHLLMEGARRMDEAAAAPPDSP